MRARLTPVECERLQGLPAGWTCLCTSMDDYARAPAAAAARCTCSPAPRYKALGCAESEDSSDDPTDQS